MNDINIVTLTGRLTADPVIRTTNGGKNVASFSLAVNKKYGETESVSFLNCTAWAPLADWLVRDCHKGTPIIVNGYLQTRTWEDKSGGGRRSAVEVVVSYFRKMDSGKGAPVQEFVPAASLESSPFNDADLPF